jgi:FXSXX-COOH protein
VSIRVPDGTEVRADAVRIPDVRYQSLDQLLDHPMVQEVITNGTDEPRKVRVAAFNSAI